MKQLSWVVALSVVGFVAAGRADAGSAGMKAYIDPATGRLSAPPSEAPPPEAPQQRSAAAMSTSAAGLVEVPGTTPAGGVMLNLQGRFRNAFVATVSPAGTVSARCAPAAAE